jgi:hypothetical protein
MGFFSSIGNFFKGILNGIKSVFQWVGKILSSPVGKVLMIGAAVFTAGTALLAGTAAGIASSETGAGFLDSFVQGGSSFVQALGSPISTAESIANNGLMSTGEALANGADAADLGSAAAAQAGASPMTAAEQSAAQNGVTVSADGAPASVGVNSSQVSADNLAATQSATGAGAGTTQVAQTPIGQLAQPDANSAAATNAANATNAPGSTAATQNAVAPVSQTGTSGGPLNTATSFGNGSTPFSGNATVGGGTPAPSGILSQAANAIGKIPSPVAIVGGQALSGYAQGKAAENIAQRQWQQSQYTNNLWGVNSPTPAANAVTAAAGQPLQINPGYLQHAQNIANFMNGKLNNSPTTVSLGSPNVTVGSPNVGGGAGVPNFTPPTQQGG